MLDRLEREVGMLDRHLRVLRMVIDEEPIGIHTIADATGMAPHKARYSLRVLEKKGLVEPTNKGARVTDRTHEFVESVDGQLDEIRLSLVDVGVDR